MKFLKFYFSWLILSLLISGNTYSQQSKFKAIIMFNFTKYIEWPNITNNEFIISVLDNKELSDELRNIAKVKGVGTNKLIIKDILSIDEISHCQIIYIPQKKFKELANCIAKSGKQNVLIVTEMDNGCKNGAGINIISNEGKINFEINKNNITNRGLILSGHLLSLGKEVN